MGRDILILCLEVYLQILHHFELFQKYFNGYDQVYRPTLTLRSYAMLDVHTVSIQVQSMQANDGPRHINHGQGPQECWHWLIVRGSRPA